MTVVDGLAQALMADGTLSTLLGNRLYPLRLPEAPTYPAAVYQVISGGTRTNLDGSQTEVKRIEYSVFAVRYLDTKTISSAISDVLDGYVGTLPNGQRVLICVKTSEGDEYMEFARVYRVLTEFSLEFSN